MNEELENALVFIAALAMEVSPRQISLLGSSQPPLVAYSDAEFTPGKDPRLGWVVFESDGNVVEASTSVVEPAIVDNWKSRTQQIFPAESLAPSSALSHCMSLFRGRDIIWFVDNDASCSTLVRGA